MKIYTIVEIDIYENEYSDDEYSEGITEENVSFKIKKFTIKEVLEDPHFRRLLIENGWADTNPLKSLSTEDSFGPRTFLLNQYGGGVVVDPKFESFQSVCSGSIMAVEIGLDVLHKINHEAAKSIESTIRQRDKMTKSSMIAEEKRKKILAERKQLREARKIEKAKQILEQAGIKVGNHEKTN